MRLEIGREPISPDGAHMDRDTMRIAFVTIEYPPRLVGGAGTYAHELCSRMGRRGHEVTVFMPERRGDPAVEGSEGVTVRPVPVSSSLPPSPQFWRKLPCEVMEEGRFDIVHLNSYNFLFLPGRRVHPCPHVMTVHHLAVDARRCNDWTVMRRLREPGSENSYFVPWVERSCVRACDLLAAVSPHSRERTVEHYGVEPGRVIVVPNGFSPPRTVPAEAAERFRREHLEQGFNVLFVGRFEDPRKGFDILLEALALLPPSVRLTVAGKGDRTTAERTIGKLGLSPRIRFTGFLTDDELASAYAACDLFVCPSRMEGFGLTAAQALSAGRPLVASRVGNLPHLVGDDEQLVPSDRPEELAEAIWRFAGDPVLRAAKGQRNRERALRLPSWEDTAGLMENAYRELCRTARGVAEPLGAPREPMDIDLESASRPRQI